MPLNVVGRGDDLGQAKRQPLRVGGVVDVGLDDREFVAADARYRVGFAHAAAQPAGHGAQQLVADGVSERIVDVLEVVEVEAQDGEPLPALHMDERLGETLAQQQAVGKVGQRIVARHVRDLHFRPAPLGDVFVGGDPAAAGHRHVHHGDGAAVVELDELAGRGARLDGRGEALEVLVGVA